MNDPNDISLWKLKNGSTVLAQVLKFIPGIKSQKVVRQALNGAIYVQQIGNGVQKAAVTIFVESQEELMAVDKCNAEGRFLNAYYKGTLYFGIIEDEEIEWEEQEPGKCYTAVLNYQISNAIKDGLV